MKIGNTEIPGKFLLIAVAVVIAILVGVYVSWPKPLPPVDTAKIINDTKKEMEKQYTAQLKEKDDQISDFRTRLTVSEGKYSALVTQYRKLQKEKENVKPPTTNKEIRDRLSAAGFAPLPVP